MVADAATTAAAQAATAGTRSTVRTGTVSARSARGRQVEPHEGDRADDGQRGDEQKRRTDAAGLVQPAAERRAEHEREARPRHDEADHAAAFLRAVEVRDQREADDPGHRVGGALHQPRGEQPRQALGEREDGRCRASASRPPTIGGLRPMRSDTAPIGIDTVSSVTPNDANSSPIIVGDAPSRRLRSGSTGTAIE